MSADTEVRKFFIKSSEKCYRFKPEAFCNHAPTNKGIYELVTFDEKQNPLVLYVGQAFDKNIRECLEAHAAGTKLPSAEQLFGAHENIYFDYIVNWNAKSVEDATDVYWWLVQKHKPVFNDVANVTPSGRPGTIEVSELE